ncbi:MAG: AAA family ATPase [Gammaproteobacteria bacterium]|nr:AAA family ATPase [Gammaproteobacteria bacterium]
MTGYPLDKISIKGFRSIKELDNFPLSGLNVLIGANGSGKSNFLEVFKLVKAISQNKLQEYTRDIGNPEHLFFNGVGETDTIEIGVGFGENNYTYKLRANPEVSGGIYLVGGEYSKDYQYSDESVKPDTAKYQVHDDIEDSFSGRDTSASSQLHQQGNYGSIYATKDAAFNVNELIDSWMIYDFHNTDNNSLLRGEWSVNDITLHSSGRNLAPFLMNLRDHHPFNYKRFINHVRVVMPIFGDCLFKPTKQANGEETVGLEWRHKNSEFVMHSSQISDGILKFMALVACLDQPHPPATIVLDGPESGLHHFAAEIFGDMLTVEKETPANIKTSQIIAATQSTNFINPLDPEDIITVNNFGKGSEFKRVNKEELGVWLDNYSLGGLWYKNVIEALSWDIETIKSLQG